MCLLEKELNILQLLNLAKKAPLLMPKVINKLIYDNVKSFKFYL